MSGLRWPFQRSASQPHAGDKRAPSQEVPAEDLPPPPAKQPNISVADSSTPVSADFRVWLTQLQGRVDQVSESLKGTSSEFQAFQGFLSEGMRKLDERVSKLETRTQQVEARLNRLEKRPASPEHPDVEEVTAKVASVADQLGAISNRQEAAERVQRSSNLMFWGIKEDANGNSTVDQVAAALSAVASPAASKVVSAVRVGRLPSEGSSAKARPIKASFADASAVPLAFRVARSLRMQHGIRVDRDLTPQQQQEKRDLQPAFTSLKERGFFPTWRSSKLLYAESRGGPLKPWDPVTGPPLSPSDPPRQSRPARRSSTN